MKKYLQNMTNRTKRAKKLSKIAKNLFEAKMDIET